MKVKHIILNVVLVLFCLGLLIPSVIYLHPPLVGADGSYTVLSGSMSPALCPGDLILVKAEDPASVNVGDIMAVKTETGVYTHRVFDKKLENGVILFKTKGDANEDPDPAYFDASQLVGRVVLVVPFRHLYTPYGFLSLVLAPTALIVGRQMHRIYEATKRRNRKELMRWRRKNRKSSVLEMSTLLLALILVASTTRIMAPFVWVGSRSYFCDVEHAWGVFSAGHWVIRVTVEIKPDIEPDTLNLGSKGNWTTCYIELPLGYDAGNIDITTVRMEDTIPAETDPSYGFVKDPEIEDRDGNGIPELMVKFDRAAVIKHIRDVLEITDGEVTLTITGEVDGETFEGSDTIQVIS